MVGVEHGAGRGRVELLLGDLRPRQGQQPVEVGPDHRGLAGLLAAALEAGQLALGLLAHVVGHAGLGDLGAVVVAPAGLVALAELLADGLQLATQHVLALLLRRAGLDVLAQRLAHLQLGEPLALQAQGQLQALAHVERLEQGHLLVVGGLGRPAGGVRQRAGLVDAAQERRHAAVVAAQLEDLLDHHAVRALQLADPAVAVRAVLVRRHVDAQVARFVGVARAGPAAVRSGELHGGHAVRESGAARDVGDRAHGSETTLVARDEQDLLALLGADLGGRDHDGHAREDHVVVDGDQQQLGHSRHPITRTDSSYKC